MDPDKTEEKVFNLFNNRFKFRRDELKLSSRLFHDLGIDGADAQDLFEILEDEYSVDLQNLIFDDFFGEEAAFNPFIYLYLLIFKRGSLKKKPLYISDIIKVVKEREWPDKSYFNSRRGIFSF